MSIGIVIGTHLGSEGLVGFDPKSVANLALWFDATKITPVADGTAISQWNDLSTNANHAIQVTGTKQPLYKVAIQAGKPGLLFDNTDDCLQTTNNLTANVPGVTVFAVANSGTVNGTIIENSTNYITPNGFLVGRNTVTDVTFAAMGGAVGQSSANSVGKTISTTRLIAAVFDKSLSSGEVKIYSNGVDVTTVSSNSNNLDTILATASKMNLGARNNGASQPLNGYLHEVMVYLRALAASERQSVESYLREKWAAT